MDLLGRKKGVSVSPLMSNTELSYQLMSMKIEDVKTDHRTGSHAKTDFRILTIAFWIFWTNPMTFRSYKRKSCAFYPW